MKVSYGTGHMAKVKSSQSGSWDPRGRGSTMEATIKNGYFLISKS